MAERGQSTGGRWTSTRGSWIQALLVLAVVTMVYGLVPWRRVSLQSGVVVAITFVIGLLGAGALVISQAVNYRRAADSGIARLRSLLMAVYVAVLFFATAFYLLQRADPQQFTGLVTRLDSFYFTLTVLSTVGFGDVHANGQAARAMVCAQMLFNLLVVSLAVRVARDAGPPRLERRKEPKG